MPNILTINAGSSSVKFAVYQNEELKLTKLIHGNISKLRTPNPNLTVFDQNNSQLVARDLSANETDYKSAVNILLTWIDDNLKFESIEGVGHRFVHGGSKFIEPTKVTPEILIDLKKLIELDPLHLIPEIDLIEQISSYRPELTQIVCFDTGFHHGMPHIAQLIPISARFQGTEIRRYGFHGLSYTFLLSELSRIAGSEEAEGRIVFAHLGSGSSMAAVKRGQCLDTTMGLTPLGGIVMGTRPGDLDPGVILHMMRKENLSPAKLEEILYEQSGMLGVSQKSSDIQELFKALDTGDQLAKDALNLFAYQAKKMIGSFTAVLGGIDTLVFSGGIGENSPRMREMICDNLEYLGIHLDRRKNNENDSIISGKGRVKVLVIRTDEEIVIAEAIQEMLKKKNKIKN